MVTQVQQKRRRARSESRPPTAPGGLRELLVIALPMIASNACETAMTFTDRLFLSQLGPANMNAALGGGLMCYVLATFTFGLTGYTTAMVAQYLGAGQQHRCALAAAQAILVSLISWPLLYAARPLIHLLMQNLSIPPEQLGPQIVYFDILLAGVGFGLLRNSLSGFFSGLGRTRVVLISTIVAMVVNVGANYVLIFGKLGLPAMGIRGAAIGTVLGGVGGLAVLMAAFLSVEMRREFHIVRSLRFNADAMWRLWRFGSPAGVERLLNVMAFTSVIMIFHTQGLATATATTIMFNWDLVSFVPLLGLQVGVTSLVGRYMGAGSPDTAHRAVMSGLKTGWVYSAAILVLFVTLPEYLVAVFEPQGDSAAYAEAVPIAVYMIRMAALYVTIDAVIVVFSGALRGAGDTVWAMLLSVSLHWLLVPLLYVTLNVVGASPQVAWTVLVCTYFLFSGMFYLRYRGGKWRTIRVVESKPAMAAAEGS